MAREWCPGSNKPAENKVEKMHYGQLWSRCGQCGRNTAVSANGNLWRHKRDTLKTVITEEEWKFLVHLPQHLGGWNDTR